MVDQSSAGPPGPAIGSVEAVSNTVYKVRGENFASTFKIEVHDSTGHEVQDAVISDAESDGFTLTLAYAMPGPYSLSVMNPDGGVSTVTFQITTSALPGTMPRVEP